MKNEIIKIDKFEKKENLSSGGTAIIIDTKGKKYNGITRAEISGDIFKKHSVVVASACKGTEDEPEFDSANVKVFNVAPTPNLLLMRLYIAGGPIEFRMHIIVYN